MLTGSNWQKTPALAARAHVDIILLVLWIDLDFIVIKLDGISV